MSKQYEHISTLFGVLADRVNPITVKPKIIDIISAVNKLIRLKNT